MICFLKKLPLYKYVPLTPQAEVIPLDHADRATTSLAYTYVLYGSAEAQRLAPICFIALARNSELKRVSVAGLPDGLFSNQKIPIWVHLRGP
jgi:hypothetical protein